MKLTYKIASAGAVAALMATAFAPLSFASVMQISGNGPGSHNGITTITSHSFSTKQTNMTGAFNGISVSSTTGGNHANGNTGGTTTVHSGKAGNTVSTLVGGSSNTATKPSCGCVAPSDAFIIGNGPGSVNGITSWNFNTMSMTQGNTTDVMNLITADAATGGNSAMGNTGGTTSVTSGDVANMVTSIVSGSSNSL